MANFFSPGKVEPWKNHISANTPFTDFAPEAQLKQKSYILRLGKANISSTFSTMATV